MYAIQPGRGLDQAAAILRADFAGILVRDGWAPYRQFTHAVWQSCVDHLLRRCQTVHLQHPSARIIPSRGGDDLTHALDGQRSGRA